MWRQLPILSVMMISSGCASAIRYNSPIDNEIDLQWDAPRKKCTYEIYRSDTWLGMHLDPFQMPIGGAGVPWFRDYYNIKSGTSYYYEVWAQMDVCDGGGHEKIGDVRAVSTETQDLTTGGPERQQE